MQVPINDAVTVSYVSIVHAISELEEAEESTESGRMVEFIYEALEDLRNAIRMLRPHVNVADEDTRRVRGGPRGQETMQEYFTRLGW